MRYNETKDAQVLKELLDYNEETGFFYWKERPNNKMFNSIYAGKQAGHVNNNNGYVRIYVALSSGKRKHYYAHRLAWLYVNGVYPKYVIDHINRVKSDNFIKNLRDCSQRENARNKDFGKYAGISYRGSRNTWIIQKVEDNGKIKTLGSFKTLEEAKCVYDDLKMNGRGDYVKRKKRIIKTIVSHSDLISYMHYDKESGIWYKIKKDGTKTPISMKKLTDSGYHRIGVKNKNYMSHVLAWFYVTGKWPKGVIDHIDLNRSNNKFSNLREVSNSLNAHNSRSKINRGVYKLPSGNWRASICINGIKNHLGVFSTVEKARETYKNKFFEQTGFYPIYVYEDNLLEVECKL